MEEKKENTAPAKEKTITIPFAEYESLVTKNKSAEIAYNNLLAEAKRMNEVIMEKRTSLLFRVIENAVQFSEEFVDKCVKEIEESLTIVEPESNATDK